MRRGGLLRSPAPALLATALLATPPAAAQVLPTSQDDAQKPTAMPGPGAGWPYGFRRASTFSWTRTTLSGTFLRVAGAGGARTTGGATAGTEFFVDGALGNLAVEERMGGSLGGGGGGFEGTGRIELLAGLRGYVTDVSGPFVRGGFSFDAAGNDVMDLSYGALLVKAGYQSIGPPLGVEVGAQSGYIAGAWSILSARRSLDGSPMLGAYGWVGERYVFATLEWRHYVPVDFGGVLPVDEVRSTACYLVARGYPLCLDAKAIEGGVSSALAAPAQATATYAGISFGIGDTASRLVSPKR